jgi:hypothetical protein
VTDTKLLAVDATGGGTATGTRRSQQL